VYKFSYLLIYLLAYSELVFTHSTVCSHSYVSHEEVRFCPAAFFDCNEWRPLFDVAENIGRQIDIQRRSRHHNASFRPFVSNVLANQNGTIIFIHE